MTAAQRLGGTGATRRGFSPERLAIGALTSPRGGEGLGKRRHVAFAADRVPPLLTATKGAPCFYAWIRARYCARIAHNL